MLSFVFIVLMVVLVMLSVALGVVVPPAGGVVFLAILLGMIPATVAHVKGRNFFAWWFYGSMIWLIAMPHAIVAKRRRRRDDEIYID